MLCAFIQRISIEERSRDGDVNNDVGYIAVVPELPGCSAFGKTEEETLKEVKTTRKRNPQHPV